MAFSKPLLILCILCVVHERSALGDQVGLCTNTLTTRGIIPNIKHTLVVETEKSQCQEGRDTLVQLVSIKFDSFQKPPQRFTLSRM